MRPATPPRFAGRITTWKDEQGFGFITPNGGGPAVFVHIKSFTSQRVRPVGNEIVSYELTVNERGQPRAEKVAFQRVGSAQRQAPSHSAGRPGLAFGFLALLAVFALRGSLPALVPLAYLGMSVLTFLVYALDKSAARRHAWRTSENALHLCGLLCGWPGALLAQHFIRHKSSKASFQYSLWGTVIVNCGVLGWLLHTG